MLLELTGKRKRRAPQDAPPRRRPSSRRPAERPRRRAKRSTARWRSNARTCGRSSATSTTSRRRRSHQCSSPTIPAVCLSFPFLVYPLIHNLRFYWSIFRHFFLIVYFSAFVCIKIIDESVARRWRPKAQDTRWNGCRGGEGGGRRFSYK